MRKTLTLLFFLLPWVSVFCQDKYSARLPVRGWVTELGISPSEEIWIATKAGNVYFTNHIGNTWGIGPYGSLDGLGGISETFERINFFSEDTLMISGFIQTGGNPNFVYWSGNHGKTWEKIVFGVGSWIDAAYINNNGKAWMSGSSQLIYHTKDKGKTWQSFGKVEPTGNLRFVTVHFAKDEITGLFGSTWNVIYKTTDNCKTWQKIPTPLTQKKYRRINNNERPEIYKVRIFGDHYIVNQQGRVFITKSNVIDWKYLPEAANFEVTEQDGLYIINKDLSVSLFDPQFNKIWDSAKRLDKQPVAIAVKNGKLFAYDSDKIYNISPKDFVASDLLTNQLPIPEPDLKVTLTGEDYGFSGGDILRLDKDKKQWYRFMTVNFKIANACSLNGNLIIADDNLKKYYRVNIENKIIKEFNLPKTLYDPAQIVEMHFERGYQGCFASGNSIRSYIKKGGSFVLRQKTSTPSYLANIKSTFKQEEVFKLAGIIDNSRLLNASLTDLNISGADILAYKQMIDGEKKKMKKSNIPSFDFDNFYTFPGDNIDFEFYKNVADSLSFIPEQDINDVFLQSESIFSTTTVWRRVIFVLKNGEKLIAENFDYKPNYLFTPWVITYNGLKFKSSSIKFGQQVEKMISGRFFDNAEVTKKSYAIFKIADYLYHKKLNKE
ncbi:MAG: YCF48-related protein [Mucilaginibacter sp.]|jgi:hypothetical protein|uniref:VPS10 domain-containing protein n=1 Tax=Mucilaginibacter sp. TaxID=1882438 RepID=UPI00356A98EF